MSEPEEENVGQAPEEDHEVEPIRTPEDMTWRWAMDFDPDSGEHNVFLNDQNVINVHPDSQSVVCSGARVILNNTFAKLPVAGHAYATAQFIGRGPTEFTFRFESIKAEFFSDIQSMMEELENNARNFRRIKGAARVTLGNNELLSLCGIEDGVISGLDVSTSEGGTDLYEGTISFTSDGHHNEEFRQEQHVNSSFREAIAERLMAFVAVNVRTRHFQNMEEHLEEQDEEMDEIRETVRFSIGDASIDDIRRLVIHDVSHAVAGDMVTHAVQGVAGYDAGLGGVGGAGGAVDGRDLSMETIFEAVSGGDGSLESISGADATALREQLGAAGNIATQIGQELLTSFTEGDQEVGSPTLRRLSAGTLMTFPIVPDHNRRALEVGTYTKRQLPSEHSWVSPYLDLLLHVLNQKGAHIPPHSFFVGEHRGYYRDYTPRRDSEGRSHPSSGTRNRFRNWPSIFRERGGEPSVFSRKMYGFRRGFVSVNELSQHLVDFQSRVYQVARLIHRQHGHEPEFLDFFSGMEEEMRNSTRHANTHPSYPDLDLPAHPTTGLVVDTEPDFYFFNDGEENMLSEIGPELAAEADERLLAMESSFTRLSSGNTFAEMYLGRSRTATEPAETGTITGTPTAAIEGGPDGVDVDPVLPEGIGRLFGLATGDEISSATDVALEMSLTAMQGPHGSSDSIDAIYDRRREIFRNSVGNIPPEQNATTMQVGPIDSLLGQHDRSHSFARNSIREIIEQATVTNADKTLTMRRAFPSFKVYFIEDDTGAAREHLVSPNDTVLYFDDLYNYNSIRAIRIIRSRKVPTDLCILQLTNVQGLLERRRWVSNPERQREVYTPGFEDTELENPLKKILMKEGLKVQVRLGYTNDAHEMPITFIGEVVEYSFNAEASDEVTIICQSYGAELIGDVKAQSSDDRPRFRDTPEICHTLMCCPELVHFGRFDLNPEFNPAEARSAATSRDEGDALGFLANPAHILDVGRELLTKRRTKWLLANRAADDNIFAPRVEDYIPWWDRMQNQAGHLIMWSVSVLDYLYDVDRSEGSWYGDLFYSMIPFTDVEGSQVWQRISGGIANAIGGHLSTSAYNPPSGTIWKVFKEMELRHPGWVSQPRPYGTRMTMFFGQPNQRYWADQITEEEMTVLRQVTSQMQEEWLQSSTGRRTMREQARAARNARNSLISAGIDTRTGSLTDRAGAVGASVGWGMHSLPPAYRASVLHLQNIINTQPVMNSVGEFIGKTFNRFRPFRKFHLISSEHHLLLNNVRASEKGTFNAVNLQWDGGNIYTLKADDSIPDEKLRVENAAYPSVTNETLARRYCAGLMARHLKDTYKGEFVVTGMNVDPHDALYLSDNRTGMYGICEVEQVVDSFTPNTGWTTEITPDMVVGINEWSTVSTAAVMSGYFSDLASRYYEDYGIGGIVLGLGAMGLTPGGPIAVGAAAYLAGLGGFEIIRWTQDRQPLWVSPLIFGDRPFFSGLNGFKQDGVFASLRGRWHAEVNAFTNGWRAFHLAGYLNDFSIGMAQRAAGQG